MHRLEQLVTVHRQLLRKFTSLELENGELKKKISLRNERIKQLEVRMIIVVIVIVIVIVIYKYKSYEPNLALLQMLLLLSPTHAPTHARRSTRAR
jgi:hypothetical protein